MEHIFTQDLRGIFPKKMSICNDAGDWNLDLGDLEKTFPRIQAVYHHSTPEKSGDVLSDGEPDFLGFDLHFIEEGNKLHINIDITYGDAMMFSFKVSPSNTVNVGHYNGYGSKFDSSSIFYFTEDSISEFIRLLNHFNPILGLSRDRFNFLDGNRNSYKWEKVRWISDFRGFNLLNRP